jgi:hypothetical protein
VEHTNGSVRLALPAETDLIATVAGLCLAETACCPQTRFLLEVTASQVILTLEAPSGDKFLQMLLPDDTLIRR